MSCITSTPNANPKGLVVVVALAALAASVQKEPIVTVTPFLLSQGQLQRPYVLPGHVE